MNRPDAFGFDITILGGGILGSATAYSLLKESPGLSICVIEPDPTYEFASTLRASGGCPRPVHLPGKHRDVALQHRLHQGVRAGDGVQWSSGAGELGRRRLSFIVPPDNVANLERNVHRQRAEGCVVDLNQPREEHKSRVSIGTNAAGSPLSRG